MRWTHPPAEGSYVPHTQNANLSLSAANLLLLAARGNAVAKLPDGFHSGARGKLSRDRVLRVRHNTQPDVRAWLRWGAAKCKNRGCVA